MLKDACLYAIKSQRKNVWNQVPILQRILNLLKNHCVILHRISVISRNDSKMIPRIFFPLHVLHPAGRILCQQTNFVTINCILVYINTAVQFLPLYLSEPTVKGIHVIMHRGKMVIRPNTRLTFFCVTAVIAGMCIMPASAAPVQKRMAPACSGDSGAEVSTILTGVFVAIEVMVCW